MKGLDRIATAGGVLVMVGCTMGTSPERDVAVTEQAVQTGSVHLYDFVLSESVNATGSVHVPLQGLDPTPDGLTAGANCGVTFISPHYAITAGHCVDNMGDVDGDGVKDEIVVENDPLGRPADTLEVRYHDTTGLSLQRIADQSEVLGTNLEDFRRGTTLTSEDNYTYETYDCTVSRRCGYTARNCPNQSPGGVPQSSADVALLHCPDRGASDAWVLVHTSELAVGGDVQMYWFHEVLDLPTTPQSGDRWANYGAYTEDLSQNWHYRYSHQMLPVVSSTWGDGTPYKVTAANDPVYGTTTNSWTDLFFCHGSSGSGVFQRGTTLLLGPLSLGSPDDDIWGDALLCMDNGWRPGQLLSGFTKPGFSRVLESLPEVQNDR